ncbi:hypothetical protein KC980_03345 [candidate division WWE3 bacterium]|uniref:ATPase F1/V1/A1 complex alpha/beta subunit nucleotide-binding domain-containing protein n=1 Tax=candidate division WWE3 bacterium TaxID=2053526 RepID=A0A955J2L8_UNCKA|nr:hypothetical protein [candidate division WWE3 bacterium]
MYKDIVRNGFTHYVDLNKDEGILEKLIYPVAYIRGLPNAHPDELLIFENGVLAQVISLKEDYVEALVFASERSYDLDSRVARVGNSMSFPANDSLRGKVINPFGQLLFGESLPETAGVDNKLMPFEVEVPGIDTRFHIKRPFISGVTVVDMLIPLGKGQRELVLGDRKTGKSAFILQCMLSQAREGNLCIYAGIGKKRVDIRKVEAYCVRNNIMDNVIIMSSSSSDPLGVVHITPYAAMSLAEFYRDLGRDVFLVLDDLTTHAKFYREVSLLANRFPGRAAYPGDIFYAHARLLERAGNFKHEKGEVSITCMPVVETVESDISGYIPTNLMSITDGHIFFDGELFAEGRRPAINYTLSVTRVGRQTQSGLRWSVNREVSSFMTLYEKTKGFIHFGAELNEGVSSTIETGEKIIYLFNQNVDKILDLSLQIILFSLVWVGVWKAADRFHMKSDIDSIIKAYYTNKTYKEKLDSLIANSTDLNALLSEISKQNSTIVEESYKN